MYMICFTENLGWCFAHLKKLQNKEKSDKFEIKCSTSVLRSPTVQWWWYWCTWPLPGGSSTWPPPGPASPALATSSTSSPGHMEHSSPPTTSIQWLLYAPTTAGRGGATLSTPYGISTRSTAGSSAMFFMCTKENQRGSQTCTLKRTHPSSNRPSSQA